MADNTTNVVGKAEDPAHVEHETTIKATKNVKNVALASAVAQQKPSLFTKRMFLLYYFLLIATLNSSMNGYDGSLMSGINAMPQYRKYFGFDPTAGTPSTGIVYAIYTIGNIVGSFFAGPACDTYGRRYGMMFGATFIIVGTIVQATCSGLAGFMAGRFLLGFGVATSASAGPAYVSEMAHPAYRGTMTGLYNTFYFMGQIPATFVTYGTNKNYPTSDASWRIPIWVQMCYSGIVLLNAFFLPETPRWLMANDRHDEALAVMARYHGEGDRDSPIVQLEMTEMMQEISKTGSDKRWWDYRELFNSPEVRYRSFLVFLVAFFGQWSGNGAVTYYYPQMLAGAGITSTSTQLLLNGFQSVVQFVGAVIGATFTDNWGRRPALLFSTLAIVVCFCIVTAINATNVVEHNGVGTSKSAAAANAEIAFIFLFGFTYSLGWTPNQGMYPVECLKFENRAKGMGFYNFWVNIASFYNTFVTGIAFTGAGWKYYFLFIFWDIFEAACIYLFFVETSNRTLEELTYIFQSKTPVKTSLAKTKINIIVVGDDEKGDQEIEVVEGEHAEA